MLRENAESAYTHVDLEIVALFDYVENRLS